MMLCIRNANSMFYRKKNLTQTILKMFSPLKHFKSLHVEAIMEFHRKWLPIQRIFDRLFRIIAIGYNACCLV